MANVGMGWRKDAISFWVKLGFLEGSDGVLSDSFLVIGSAATARGGFFVKINPPPNRIWDNT